MTITNLSTLSAVPYLISWQLLCSGSRKLRAQLPFNCLNPDKGLKTQASADNKEGKLRKITIMKPPNSSQKIKRTKISAKINYRIEEITNIRFEEEGKLMQRSRRKPRDGASPLCQRYRLKVRKLDPSASCSPSKNSPPLPLRPYKQDNNQAERKRSTPLELKKLL